MKQSEIHNILINTLNFNQKSLKKLEIFKVMVLEANLRHNFISKSTVKDIWFRHILDSAQIVKYIDDNISSIADFGSGAGFPGIVISIFDQKNKFHVKLFEKSPVKRAFLTKVCEKLSLNAKILDDINKYEVDSDLIVCRAFKKLDKIIDISREKCRKPHKLLILKGKNATNEIKQVSLGDKYSYKVFNSITDNDSKIIFINAN